MGPGMKIFISLGIRHHGYLAVNADLPVDLNGYVTKVEWLNPHTFIYIDVEDENGEYNNWAIELGSPNGLMRRGWTRNSLQEGDVVTVTGYRAKNAPHVGNASEVVLADGKRVFAGSSADDEN